MRVDTVVHKHIDESWYFWDEGSTNEYGPYPTQDAAVDALQEYCKLALGD
jgi:hypothetical protein